MKNISYIEVINFLKKNKKYGFTPKQISEEMNISITTVYNAVHYYHIHVKKEKIESGEDAGLYYMYNLAKVK